MQTGFWHRGYLPHLNAPVWQHLIFRTAGSLPASVLERLSGLDPQRRRQAVDHALDRGRDGLRLEGADEYGLVVEALMHGHGRRYRLDAWCVMPNHVHVLLEPFGGSDLGTIVHSWKTWSARRINAGRRRVGAFWSRDYFDRFIREDEAPGACASYIRQNPVAAGLCARVDDWPWTSKVCA
jgi:REP element-mobilizing transposase RayT